MPNEDSELKPKALTKPELEAKYAELLEENAAMKAKIETKEATTAATVPVVIPSGIDPLELVPIQLIFDGDKYKDDLFVGINLKTWQIRRGELVMVPRYVKQAIDENSRQDMATAVMIAKRVAEFQRLGKEMGVI